MNLIKRLFKALLVILILGVFALAIWQNRAWIQEHGQPLVAKLQQWASKGTWNETTEDTAVAQTGQSTKTGVLVADAAHEPETAAATAGTDLPAREETMISQQPVADQPSTGHHTEAQEPAETEAETAETPLPTFVTDTRPEPLPAASGEIHTSETPVSEMMDEPAATPAMERISQVRKWVWEGRLDKARDALQQAIEQEPENPAYLWELMQLERYSQHFHRAAQLQWRLQLLAMQTRQEQQLAQMKAWQAQVGEQQARLNARIQQLEDELQRTRDALAQPLEKQP